MNRYGTFLSMVDKHNLDLVCACGHASSISVADEAKLAGDVELAGGPDLWRGPADLRDKAKQAGLHIIYLAKQTKDQ
jgi:hypothetical protein